MARVYMFILLVCSVLAGKDSFDPYSVLGVSRDAGLKEIKRAYRTLSLQLHPDRNKDDPSTAERFHQVARAYEILSDDAARESFNIGQFQTQWEYEEWQRKNGRAGVRSKGLFPPSGPVLALDRHMLHATVSDRSKPILLMFYAPWCTHCQHFAPEYRRVALELDESAVVAAFDCEADEQVCMQEQVQGYPTLRMLTPDGSVETWQGALNRGEDILNWLKEVSSNEVIKLTSSNFNSAVLASDSVWLVDFSAGPWCGPCTAAKSTLRRAAGALSGRAKVAIVECDGDQALCQRFQVAHYPFFKLFPAGVAAKKKLNGGLGEDLFFTQEQLQFPPAGALDFTAKLLKALLPPSRPALQDRAHSHDDL